MAIPLRLKANYLFRGLKFSEVYYLTPTESPGVKLAQTKSKDLLQRRMLWMGYGCVLDYAAVSVADSRKDGFQVDMNGFSETPITAVSANATGGPINDPETSVEYRLETTAQGPAPLIPASNSTRQFRCVPDLWVQGNLWNAPFPILLPLGVGGALPNIAYQPTADSTGIFRLAAGATANLENLRRSFLDALLLYCGMLYKVGGPLGDRTAWVVNPYTRIVFRGISSHRTGGKFSEYRGRAVKSY